jgi:hypothetical protein
MQAETMWKALWKKWTIDKPAMFGDFLWEVFVVQLSAALHDRLTWERIFAFISLGILILAYYHRIPIPPELMLVGDLLAYIDIFAVVFLLGILSRAATLLFVIKQASARMARSAGSLMTAMQRLDFRHRRERGTKSRQRLTGGRKDDDDGPVTVGDFAWA